MCREKNLMDIYEEDWKHKCGLYTTHQVIQYDLSRMKSCRKGVKKNEIYSGRSHSRDMDYHGDRPFVGSKDISFV